MIKEKINELLKKNGMTFGSLSEMINVKRTTLLYHLANPKIPLRYIIDISKVFDVEVSELFDEDEVDIKGYVKYKDEFYELNFINDFVSFINILAIDCGLESDLFYEHQNKISER